MILLCVLAVGIEGIMKTLSDFGEDVGRELTGFIEPKLGSPIPEVCAVIVSIPVFRHEDDEGVLLRQSVNSMSVGFL